MRIIKFRALSMCKGERWVYGDLRHYNRNPHTEKWTVHVPETGLETDIDEVTIGQFTGLLDKNGKEIYEGDIIKCSIIGKQRMGIVKFHAGSFYLYECSGFSDEWIYNCTGKEVIGNIHDNPELLH